MHQLPDAQEIFEVVAKEQQLLPVIVEKDYWIMHCLWGMQQQKFKFEMKGGTSLSKGFNIIDRFSEDIDIQIHPKGHHQVILGKNQDKPAHIASRGQFFESITQELNVLDLNFRRDPSFDDTAKMRGAGIRAEYDSLFTTISGLKEGVVLELGFDQTTPNEPRDITSWAFEKAMQLHLPIIDNRAIQVPCYLPEYTFVEKLQTISTKYRLQQEKQHLPINFLRHYYDIYELLKCQRVLNFIGSDSYVTHKKHRFRTHDEIDIKNNPAFTLTDLHTRALFNNAFKSKAALYFKTQPNFDDILHRINEYIDRL